MEKNPKIVDLGSGAHPHPQAGVIVDKYEEPKHRGYTDQKLVKPTGAKFICADIHNLPFKDNEFNFSYCKQVLEHVTDPAKCCKEIMRISKAGYIETPTYIWEVLFGRPYHRWIIKKEGNKLIFTLKTIKNCPPNNFHADSIYSRSELFKEKFHENIDLFYIRFKWKDSFEVEVIENG